MLATARNRSKRIAARASSELGPPQSVVNFAPDSRWPRAANSRKRRQRGSIMATPKSDKHKEYARFAAHCLSMVTMAKDQDSRAIQREMAAEWLKLADAVLHPLKRTE